MKTVAVVPARKGSKRLPNKNVKLLDGKPLTQHTIDAIRNAGLFDMVIVSTDDKELRDSLRDMPGITLDERPASLATDEVQCARVLHYIIDKYKLMKHYEYLCLLLPTCPLRNEKHILESFSIVKAKKPDSVVSVRQFAFPPQFALELEAGRLVKKWDGIVRTDTAEARYYPNGAITWLQVEKFHSENMLSYYTDRSYPYIMDWKSSIDIDDEESLEIAQMIISCKNKP